MDNSFNYVDKTFIFMISAIYPHLIDVNTVHAPDFRFERRGHLTDNLIMCFRSPARILTEHGMENTQPGDCMIHSLDFHLLHYNIPKSKEGFRNDWVYVNPEITASLMNEFNLPWNILIRTGFPEILTPFIKRMQKELTVDDKFSERMIINQLSDMLATVARILHQTTMLNNEMTSMERRYYLKFRALRQEMLDNCSNDYSLTILAEKVRLSKERFAVLYRQFFGATPRAELIKARLIIARRLLITTHMNIQEIAKHCGWDDIHYFSRIFRKKSEYLHLDI